MLYLTEEAATKVSLIMSLNDFDVESSGVKIGVKSGGCSGYEYTFDVVENPEENARIFSSNGIQIFCGPKSYLYLRGTTIDYTESVASSGFIFDNPQAKRSCGCGTSFTT